MNLLFRRVVVISIAWLASGLATSLPAATVAAQTRFQVTIDGVVYDCARGYSGGDMVADLARGPFTGGVQKKHVTNILTKLDLPPDTDDHRRVLAVLRWLDQNGTRS